MVRIFSWRMGRRAVCTCMYPAFNFFGEAFDKLLFEVFRKRKICLKSLEIVVLCRCCVCNMATTEVMTSQEALAAAQGKICITPRLT